MSISETARISRVAEFAPRIAALLRDYCGRDLVRLDRDTVGVAGPALMDELMRARPADERERPTFKPLNGRSIPRREAAALMQAVGADVRSALKKPLEDEVDLSGQWPLVGHNYLRDLVFGVDPYRLKVLVDRNLELTPKLTWTVIVTGAALPGRLRPTDPASTVAGLFANASSYQQRRRAMGLYRRVAAPVCFTVAALVTGALWLGSPFDDDVPNEHLLLEALRLLPPSWNVLRRASPEFPAIDARIGADDDVLLLPLLSHRDPALWDAPDEFRPARWRDLDPETHPGYLPFGHANERCWGRHMVMPLADRLLTLLRRDGYAVSPEQTRAEVPLAGLMEVVGVRVVR
ncbi:cytochrome P450 [Kutzneria buriramensis]|uniref:Cytochrome P450 n=1 Tax=Kutzneria buriramensis TaxID=1045776 RepID=A0A3E0HFX8_9PSEU|nr:cytochrome P450 [Kutzneria buriramensis]REH44619.1 cytochrome P450 [Kutzneria buriramensis]